MKLPRRQNLGPTLSLGCSEKTCHENSNNGGGNRGAASHRRSVERVICEKKRMLMIELILSTEMIMSIGK